jgi:hypothetical protein
MTDDDYMPQQIESRPLQTLARLRTLVLHRKPTARPRNKSKYLSIPTLQRPRIHVWRPVQMTVTMQTSKVATTTADVEGG